ncbi:PRC-barrel domain containing protein [Streptomyces sp. NPDC085866]|uniref:PRC-barrel domain containing protein n=1 Tax=Streptomyces sp. NPDC085866 TaxID=3365736 RepID=UPI0037D31C6C
MLEAIYVDTTTEQPAMATVRTGLPTRQHLVVVPLDEAVLGTGYAKVSSADSGGGRPGARDPFNPSLRIGPSGLDEEYPGDYREHFVHRLPRRVVLGDSRQPGRP